jgi:hypothetical protein
VVVVSTAAIVRLQECAAVRDQGLEDALAALLTDMPGLGEELLAGVVDELSAVQARRVLVGLAARTAGLRRTGDAGRLQGVT